MNRPEIRMDIDTEEDFEEYNVNDDLERRDCNDKNNYNTTNKNYHPTKTR